MKISVVVPVYNVEKYVNRCVQSICNQTYNDLEIIIVDDGSTDSSPSICERYAYKDSRIHIIHKQNGGLVSARKAGVEEANGDYVLFVDGDDWIDKNHVRMMIDSLHGEMPDIGVTLTYTKEYSDGTSLFVKPESDCELEERIYCSDEFDNIIWKYYLDENDVRRHDIPVTLWTRIFNTSFIRDNYSNVNDDITRSEDDVANFIFFMKARSVGIVYDSGYHYVRHPGSMSTIKNNEKKHIQSYKMAQDNVFYFIDGQNISKEEKKQFKTRFYKDTYYGLMNGAGEYLCSLSEEYLFPYPDVVNGSRIIVYGLGAYGNAMVAFLEKSRRFILQGASDSRIKNTYNSDEIIKGYTVTLYCLLDLIKLSKDEYDYIIITVSRRNMVRQIEDKLVSLGIDYKKIAHMDNNLLNNDPFRIEV